MGANPLSAAWLFPLVQLEFQNVLLTSFYQFFCQVYRRHLSALLFPLHDASMFATVWMKLTVLIHSILACKVAAKIGITWGSKCIEGWKNIILHLMKRRLLSHVLVFLAVELSSLSSQSSWAFPVGKSSLFYNFQHICFSHCQSCLHPGSLFPLWGLLTVK